MAFTYTRWGLLAVLIPASVADQTPVDINKKPTAFDCSRKWLEVDYVICASPELMNAEADLEQAYRHARKGASDVNQIKADQQSWSLHYGSRCGLPAKGEPPSAQALQARECVKKEITDRTAYLKSHVGGGDRPTKKPAPTTHELTAIRRADTPFTQNTNNGSRIPATNGGPAPPPKARAAYDYLHEHLNKLCAKDAGFCDVEGSFEAEHNNVCHIGSFFHYTDDLIVRHAFKMSDIDVASFLVKGEQSERVLNFNTIGGKYLQVNNYITDRKQFEQRWHNAKFGLLMIGNDDEQRIMQALHSLAIDCGASESGLPTEK
jgi:uncharacterized protein YecT (DUF1311 family)